MFPKLNGRLGHYTLLLLAAAWLFLPRLGTPSLWDIDEGHNTETARGMLESGDWVMPKFNGALRVDKPALLYWLQASAYEWFGVNEFSGRLPSALAAALTLLLTYELGRRMFSAQAGLLAGLVLGSTLLFCGSAHFANPDMLLNACTVLTFLLCWRSLHRHGVGWPALAGAATGLGMLAKGPVGLVLPFTVAVIFLVWTRQLQRLWGPNLFNAPLLFVLVAGPWFALVGSETKGDFLRGFLLTHNVERFSAPMENHGGPFYYHVLSLTFGFLPWAAFFGLVLWDALRQLRSNEPQDDQDKPRPSASARSLPGSRGSYLVLRSLLGWSLFFVIFFLLLVPGLDALLTRLVPVKAAGIAMRVLQIGAVLAPLTWYALRGPCPGTAHSAEKLLLAWVYVYLVFFSLSQTKLPNYMLPAYPPMALLTGRFLDRWRRGVFQPNLRVMNLVLPFWILVGVGTGLALLVAAGKVGIPYLRSHQLPGLESGAILGLVLVAGAGAGWLFARRQARDLSLASLVLSGLLFTGGLATWGGPALDEHKAVRSLVEAAGVCETCREVHIGCYGWYQPSLVFYCRREVRRFLLEEEVRDHLRCPLPAYLFVPANVWQYIEKRVNVPHRVLARHWDFYRNCEVLVVGNR